MPVILAEDLEFKPSLGYITRFCLTWLPMTQTIKKKVLFLSVCMCVHMHCVQV